MKRLNLGCGRDYKEGYDNWDISKEVHADAYIDIRTERFPAEDNTYDEIYCSGVLEQVLQNEHLVHVMNECHRVLKRGCDLTLIVPNSMYSITFQDPFDCRHFLPDTFNYFDQDHRHYQLYGSVYGFKPWKFINHSTNERRIMRVDLRCQKE